MLHADDIERIRRMTPAERIEIALALTDLGWEFLGLLPHEEEQRFLDGLLREPWNPPRTSEFERD